MRAQIAFGQFKPFQKHIGWRLNRFRFRARFVELDAVDPDRFDLVAPLTLKDYDALAQWPELRGRRFLHPDRSAVELCDDKLAFARFLESEGLDSLAPARRAPGAPYPYVWKRRRGMFGVYCRVVHGPEDEAELDLDDPEWFAQSLVAGEFEYATHILRSGGAIRYACTVQHRMAGPAHVLGRCARSLEKRAALGSPWLDVFETILARMGYEGTACFDYKLEGGRPRVFEINPRFGGSLCRDINRYLAAYRAALA